jgi:S1-C subfamily serine protease
VGRAELEGAAVTAVSSGSIAERAGLHVGDVINFVDDKQIKTAEEFTAELSRKRPWTQVRIGWVFRSSALGYIPKSAFLMLGTQAR